MNQFQQWSTDVRAAAVMMALIHTSGSDALAQRLAEIADKLEDIQ